MSAIQYNTSKLVWIMQRNTHPEHAEALAEAKRRCSKPGLKAKNVVALEAAIVACDTGAPVPARGVTLRRTQPAPVVKTTTRKRTNTVGVNSLADKALAEGTAMWVGDMLVSK